MKLRVQIDRINRLHALVSHRHTGSPEELAEKLRLSRSGLFRLIEELRLADVPIRYSRHLRTYFYPGLSPKVLIQINIADFEREDDEH